jgi:2,4-dienoyl-CoA reductase-like NADH-dependent reductase (Old Yellow Enzyme family)
VTNHRTDEFGGSPAKRAEVVLRIIHGIRAATSTEFCIGIKMNSVDAATSESVSDVVEQISLIAAAGIDFIEISGGTYENPSMMVDADATPAAQKTAQRESFFLEFARTVRESFPALHLMVTGGFRTRAGMEAAVRSRGCDLVGIGRPAAVVPRLPREIVLNAEVPEEDAHVALAPLQVPFFVRHSPVKQVGAGYQSMYYAQQIQRMGKGLVPLDTRLRTSKV